MGEGSLVDHPGPQRDDNATATGRRTLEQEVALLERRLITQALEEVGHNHTHAARLLGLSRVGLLKKVDRMGLR